MASRDEQWWQAWRYMRDGGKMPEYLKRILNDHPAPHITPFGGMRDLNASMDSMWRTVKDVMRAEHLNDKDWRKQYENTPLDATDQKPDHYKPLTDQDVRGFIDKIPNAPTFPGPPPPTLRFMSSAPADQVRAASKALMDRLAKQYPTGPFGTTPTTQQQAAYADKDGHFEEWTEPLEEWDGELCMTCGASWPCEHKTEHT